MSDTTDLFDIVEAVKHHVVKAVYRTTPSHSDKKLPKWKKGNDDTDLSKETGLMTRLFDVVEQEDSDVLEWVFSGSGVDDYDVSLAVQIAYPATKIDSIALSDGINIKNELMGSTNIEILDLGFNCFTFDTPQLEPIDDESEYRLLELPFIARVSVGKKSTIEEWQDGALGIDVQDT
jgi:hypothetical protein